MVERSGDGLSGRVERLEGECRRWRRGGVVAAVAGAVALGAGGARRDVDVGNLKVESLTVVDAQGRDAIILATDRNGAAVMDFLDAQGKRRVVIGVGDGSPTVSLTDGEGRERLAMKVDPRVGGSLAALDETHRPRLLLFAAPNGISAVGILNADGASLLEAGSDASGTGRLTLRDKDGKALFQAPKP